MRRLSGMLLIVRAFAPLLMVLTIYWGYTQMIDSFRARAILAFPAPIRFTSPAPQALSVLQRFVRVSNTPAASYK